MKKTVLQCQKLSLQAFNFLRFLMHSFKHDNCLGEASALAYTTLLSLVPLMTLMFGILAAFPAFNDVRIDIQEFVFSNFLPASRNLIQDHLLTFTSQTSKLTTIGVAVLLFTAVLMIKTVDKTLNDIWHTSHERRPIVSFMVYWSMLTVVPLLVGVSVFLSSYLISLPLFSEVDPSARQTLLSTLPFTTSATAFTLFYMLIPNRKVVWRHALIGGVIAAILFGFAKYGFAIYVTHSDVYETVYGTLSTIPLFLIWIYVSWIVVLLGAEITYCLDAFRWREDTVKHDQSNELLVAYRLLGHLWVAQCAGKTIQVEQLLAWESNGDEDMCLAILERLRQATWIYRTADAGQWGLARDLGEISLLDFYQLMGQQVFLQPKNKDIWNCNLAPILAQVCLQAETVMNIPLKQLYKREIEHKNESQQQTVSCSNPNEDT